MINVTPLICTIKLYCEQILLHKNKQVVSTNKVGASLTVSKCNIYLEMNKQVGDSQIRELLELVYSNLMLLYTIPNIRCPYHSKLSILHIQLRDILDSNSTLFR